MKRIKSNHLWRRGATLLLAMLMLFTCVGSALPAFAEEAAGNTATVDSGDPVLADSSASGDSTGDTGTDLPDDPQRPTLPSGEDISEEAPPADESDGETVPPADSDSSEDPAAPDSGDSIPDESESEPAEQPGEGDADLPEDEQPSGEEPDPDEDEEIPENEPEDEPFEALVILDPENGAAVQAGVGEEVTFKAPVSREDVAVAYQWQRFQKPAAGSVQTEALYDYAEGETTEYWYALDDMREAEALAMNPDMLWPGIEMYYATVAALDEIGADSSDVSIAWKTPNFALEGYTISAAETESGIEVYADKDDERHVAHLNENSEWEFGEAEEKPETTGAWLNIEGANGPEYAFTVEERDYDASFRCEVTVLDEVYLEQCLSILEEQGIELTEEQRAAEQKLYSVVMSVENGKEEALPEDEPMTFSMARSMLRAAASGKPQLSADAQWIEGLDGNYQYITKDTYDRVSEWLAKGEITETQAARYWTYLRPNGYTGSTVANVLDENGKPTGTTRQYQGFDLTDGMLEVNSEWYGKTVYFRVAGSGGTGTAITIPAYTELETDENGNYIEGASGTKYKKAITFGDYFDANGYGPISCSALGIYARNNWCSDYNAWMSGVDDVYTYYGAAGNVAFNMSYEGHGTDYTGNYAVLYYLNVYDLTAAFGAGKEPDAAQCRTWFYGGSNPMANADYVASKTVTVGEQIITDVRHYAVEYDIPSLAFAVTDHSAEDETYIGTNAKYTPQPGDKTVTAIIDGNSKVYDGVQISPSAFTVYGAEGASESLFNITYTVEQGSYASYSPRTVNGSSWRDTGAVNAARYHAVAALTDAAIKAGWKLSDDSVLECDLIIYQRPINVYSYHNNRVYDQTSAGVIRNIQPEARSGDSGIIPGDTVRFNTTTVFGSYVDKNGKAAVHNSNTNNGGSEYTMYRSATLSDLYVLHTGGSDPHHNYTLGTETYTGAINKRPVVVHSLYLDDPENPRNVKTYDSTNQATITDILIDNVLPGDEIGLKQQTMTGTYATAQAGETLTADGKTQKDRLKKLKENVITASTKAELTGNDFGDYFIEKESYSGAICREVLEVRIKNQVKLYGEADIETPWHINSFDANSTALSRKYRWKIFSATRPSFWTRRITAAAVFGAQEQKS